MQVQGQGSIFIYFLEGDKWLIYCVDRLEKKMYWGLRALLPSAHLFMWDTK